MWFRVILSAFAFLWTLKEIALPLGAAAVFSGQFIRQVTECDSAMDAEWYNRQAFPEHGASDTIHLLDCHEYDKTRKLLLASGLPEEYLSWLSLKALEIHQRPASEFVELHRFDER